jgi:hypothetical protein
MGTNQHLMDTIENLSHFSQDAIWTENKLTRWLRRVCRQSSNQLDFTPV